MAEIVQTPIRSVYKDDSIVISNVKSKIDNTTTSYTVVNTWHDSTPMDDTKVDQFGIYSKYKPTGEYLRENKPQWGELLLEVDTVAELRDMTPYNQFLIKIGYYKGVRLSGYYVKGDTPGAINYKLSSSPALDDNGGTFVIGNIKLEHDFNFYVDFRYYGIKGDGSDETARIQRAMNRAIGGFFFVPKAKTEYFSGQILPPANTNAEFDSEVIWKCKDGLPINSNNFEVLIRFENVDNCIWNCNNAIFYMNKAYYLPLIMSNGKTSEHNHIFMFNAVKNVEILRAKANSFGCDGFYMTGLGSARFTYSEDVKLTWCIAHDNKRNGCSVVGGYNIYADDCIFSGSSGSTIQAGFDIEPEARCEKNNKIYLNRCKFLNNNGKGFVAALGRQTRQMSKEDLEIILTDCYSEGNERGFTTQFNIPDIIGKVSFIRCTSNLNRFNGFYELSSGIGVQKLYDSCTSINDNTSGDISGDTSFASAWYARHYSADLYEAGNSRLINCSALDTRAIPLVIRPFAYRYYFETTFAPKDIWIENFKVIGVPEETGYIDPLCDRINIKYRNKPVFDITGGGTHNVENSRSGCELTNLLTTTNKVCALPVSKSGLEFTFKVSIGFTMTIFPQSGAYIAGLTQSGIAYTCYSNTIGDYITLKGRSDGNWDVVAIKGTWSNLNQTWATSSRPQTPKISRMGYNSTNAAMEYWEGSSWISLSSSLSGTWLVSGTGISSATATFAKVSKLVFLSGSFTLSEINLDVTITLPYAPDFSAVIVSGNLTFNLVGGSTTATVKSSIASTPQSFQINYKTA